MKSSLSFVVAAVFVAYALEAPLTLANLLLGGTAATHMTSSGATVNPGNAGFLSRSEISMSPVLYKSESLQVRYPGFETVSDNSSGLGNLLEKPSFIYKVTPRLGIGGYVVPPLPFKVQVEKKKIPVVVLDTLNFVDISGSGQLGGAAEFVMGYRFGDTFGMGAHASFESVTYEATLTSSEDGANLASVKGSQTIIDMVLGARWEVFSKHFVIATAAALVRSVTQKTDVESPLLATAGSESSLGQTSSNTAALNPLDSFLLGLEAAPSAKLKFMVDFEFRRAAGGGRAISLVDLKEKEKDVYSTLAVRTGASVNIVEGSNLLAGFRYEPASLGPGSREDGGKSGYGTLELVKLFAGMDDLRPYWEAALGLERSFGKKRGAGRSKSPAAASFHPWTARLGLTYRRASLGIDEDGELPGAYLHTKVTIPAQLTYMF